MATLSYDKRKKGSHGRCLQADLPNHGLKKFDRLEPSPSVFDVAAIDSYDKFPEPLHLIFWRPGEETLCTHRCALFSKRSGLCAELLCSEEMHTAHLGVFLDFNVTVMWQVLESGVLHPRGNLAEDAYFEVACLHLRSELFAFYSREKQNKTGRPIYELSDFRLSMLGDKVNPIMTGVKAAESGTLVLFCAYLAKKFSDKLPGGRALADCGEALCGYLDATRSEPLKMSKHGQRRMCKCILRFVSLREKALVPWKPKVHLFLHFISDSRRFGNPLHTAAWVDEGLNMRLASVCSKAD